VIFLLCRYASPRCLSRRSRVNSAVRRLAAQSLIESAVSCRCINRPDHMSTGQPKLRYGFGNSSFLSSSHGNSFPLGGVPEY
jgi:hypothetical protein